MFNVLPKAGGTENQDPVFMRDLRTITSIENSFENNKAKLEDVKRQLKEHNVGRKL